jgi:undecaprenyl-diphosphatase
MEQQILFTLNRDWTAPWLDRTMAIVTSWPFWWPILLVLGLVVVWRGGFHARSLVFCAALTIGLVDGVVVQAVKKTVGRPRPHGVLEGVRQIDLARARPRLLAATKPLRIQESAPEEPATRGNSFPSGHSANNFALATVVFLFYRRWGWLCFLPAAVVAWSRVYVGAHWPLDVVVGAFLGAGTAWVFLGLLERIWRKYGGRIFPTWRAAHPSLLQGRTAELPR